eukprot:8042461-Ditylum_brightwellii.AAC.1
MEELDRKIPAEKKPPSTKTSVILIPCFKMKMDEAKKLSRWECAISEKHGEFLTKLATSKKKKER